MKALVVVDMQVDFVTGALGFPEAETIVPRIAQKIHDYRQQGWEILFTMDTHSETYLDTQEGKRLPVPHCLRDTPGWQLCGEIAACRQPQDRCFCKPEFGSGELFDYLRGQDPYEEIELVGLVTNLCVLSQAVLVKTAQPEATLVVDAGCVRSYDPALHEKTLDVMAGMQIQIRNR